MYSGTYYFRGLLNIFSLNIAADLLTLLLRIRETPDQNTDPVTSVRQYFETANGCFLPNPSQLIIRNYLNIRSYTTYVADTSSLNNPNICKNMFFSKRTAYV